MSALTARAALCDAPSMDTCTAKWEGGRCDRPATVAGCCSGHYAQKRRRRPFSALKGAHGKPEADLVLVPVRVPTADAETFQDEAGRRDVPVAEIYREAVAAHAARLRKRA